MSPSTCGDAQAADVLRQIAPVRSDVAERRGGAALVRLEAPRVVGVLQQPVLQVVRRATKCGVPMSPRGDRVPRLLHQRVAAIVERHRVDDAGLGRLVEQRLRLGRGHRQRLVRDDVLALGDRRRVHRVVQVVRRRVVDDVDVGIVEQRLVAAVGLAGRRARPPSSAPTPRCCRRPRRRRRSRAAAPRRCDAGRRSPRRPVPSRSVSRRISSVIPLGGAADQLGRKPVVSSRRHRQPRDGVRGDPARRERAAAAGTGGSLVDVGHRCPYVRGGWGVTSTGWPLRDDA